VRIEKFLTMLKHRVQLSFPVLNVIWIFWIHSFGHIVGIVLGLSC